MRHDHKVQREQMLTESEKEKKKVNDLQKEITELKKNIADPKQLTIERKHHEAAKRRIELLEQKNKEKPGTN